MQEENLTIDLNAPIVRSPAIDEVRSMPGMVDNMQVIQAFRAQFTALPQSRVDPLYALPTLLIESIRSVLELKDFFSPSQLEFERSLTEFCCKYRIVGVAENTFIWASLFNAPGLDQAAIEQMMQDAGDKTSDRIQRLPTDTVELVDENRRLQRAYVGWLMTNPIYLAERDHLRAGAQAARPQQSFSSTNNIQVEEERLAFHARWRLSGMSNWELPIRQGENFGGALWPASINEKPGMSTFTVSDTYPGEAKVPLKDIVSGVARAQREPHLDGWYKILDRKNNARGQGFYRRVATVNFYLNLALRTRYERQMNRKTMFFDEAFARWLGDHSDLIRKARAVI